MRDRPNESPEPNKTFGNVLKECQEELSGPLTDILNHSTLVLSPLPGESPSQPNTQKDERDRGRYTALDANNQPISLASLVG